MLRAVSGSRSLSGYTREIPAFAAAAGVREQTPQTATAGTGGRCAAAARATPAGALPRSVCSSREPSPVITRSAPSR